ncbi:MAG: host-nuclease inhibitor Gam family protein [Acidaminococcaceae bacterium]
MARTRIKIDNLNSWDEVDANLKLIGEIDNKVRKIEAEMNDKIAEIKAKADAKIKYLVVEKERMELEIKDYAETNRADLSGKTKIMTFGQLGFRQSTSIIVKKVQAVIAELKVRKLLDCITVKESVNKDNLRKQPEEVIVSLGCTKKVEDVFWYEPDYEKLS